MEICSKAQPSYTGRDGAEAASSKLQVVEVARETLPFGEPRVHQEMGALEGQWSLPSRT